MSDYSVAMMGATGAVGSEAFKALLKESHLIKGISTFGRRPVENITSSIVQQHQIDIFQPEGYEESFAEMSSEEKNKISHRGLAIKKLVEFLNAMD